MSRIFTRANIVKFFEETFVDYDGGAVHHLEEVQLLPDVPDGAWLVNFTMDVGRKPNKPMMMHQVIVIQINDDLGPTRPYLRLVSHVELPSGFATVEEEDAEIERQGQAIREHIQAIRKNIEDS